MRSCKQIYSLINYPSMIKVGINQSDQLFASEWAQNAREKRDFRMVGACKVRARFLEAFIC